MKRLTRRLALLGRFNGNALISFRGPSSIGLRSIHLAPTTPAHPSSESSAPATDAAKDPRWVLLPCRDSRRDDDGSLVTNAKTMGEASQISFELAAPPASSFLYYNYDCDGDGYPDPVNVVAAHGDSVLLLVSRGHRDASSMATYDHFVYRAGGAAGRPPSLTLLPARNIPKHYEVDGTSQGLLLDPYSRALLEHDTGVLRRGEDDLVNVGAAGRNAVRFVNIEPHCCCGGFGRSSCARSRFAFVVTTWTLTLTMDGPMKWVKDAVLDCEELWALPGYEGLPRVHLECPIVSLDNPDIVCFKVNGYYENHKGSWKIWMIQVDTRNKALLSAVEYTDDAWKATFRIPAKL
ncbi:unnamed protein product [Urochloa decumbens]|uniref:DUF1618 domain-containing protein n=1 Tax=Urochloa decumbens TaxID=240449 RepID=A0ABC9GYC8_9POAL